MVILAKIKLYREANWLAKKMYHDAILYFLLNCRRFLRILGFKPGAEVNFSGRSRYDRDLCQSSGPSGAGAVAASFLRFFVLELLLRL